MGVKYSLLLWRKETNYKGLKPKSSGIYQEKWREIYEIV
jgi:hypothetical protein